MSSPQVVDSEKAAAQVEAAIHQQERARQDAALTDATSKRLAATEGMDGTYSTTDLAAQLGRPLMRQHIIARLTRLNPNLRFVQSYRVPEIGAVYLYDGVSNLGDPLCAGLRHIVGMEWTSPSPEFTVRRVANDKWGVRQMVGQIRGWRTILCRLIKERLITIEGAEREFEISRGRESQRWYEQLS